MKVPTVTRHFVEDLAVIVSFAMMTASVIVSYFMLRGIIT